MTERLEGNVKWFSDSKGFGFIQVPESQQEYFVHYKNIDGDDGHKKLFEGQTVTFEPGKGEKGPTALKVSVQGNRKV